MKKWVMVALLVQWAIWALANGQVRERLSMDFDWKFAYGHPYDAAKDFNHGTSYFSFFAKAGYGDGPAAPNFDDRSWRKLNVPHDFAVEQPFSASGSHSHGYKAIGRNFPEVSVGWYRKTFTVPKEDLDRRIVITFDGVHRDSRIWINGHYLGNEPSGYSSFSYDITQYLNYGGHNVIAVKVDVTYEEGWYYEGAGIYRHVWMTKTSPLHVAHDGTFVYSEVENNRATVFVETTIENNKLNDETAMVVQQLVDCEGNIVASSERTEIVVSKMGQSVVRHEMSLSNPHLWSIDDPYLYNVETIVMNGDTTDVYNTRTGIRTLYFDAQKGFFLNGKHVKLKGTNNHQDHAGVGTAIPDELQRFRIQKLKEMGTNAIRSSHNPATPALLDICDEMGMLVIDEHRLMGTAPFVKDQLERLIKRDRNHPSVIVWSLGNEEWAIEGNVVGERIIKEMQAFANQLDPTRPKNAASSGGWGHGVSQHIELMGFNYLGNGDHDAYHEKFPDKPSVGTEEGSTNTTRGIYFDDPEKHHIAAYDRTAQNGHFKTIEYTWNFYDERDYLSGMFIWTGFDYRGEPTPYGWPSISSYFGMYDVCGFPKDNVWYLKSWWGKEPVLHLLPHWNLEGHEGDTINVIAYSNCDEVELFVNRKSVGRKTMVKNGHLSWKVPYHPGELKAIGYQAGKKIMTEVLATTGAPESLKLEAHKISVNADGEDLIVVAVSSMDKKGRHVPVANNMVQFEISGPGKIIGVGNGDPSCLEADKFVDDTQSLKLEGMKAKVVTTKDQYEEVSAGYDDTSWPVHYNIRGEIQRGEATVYRANVDLPEGIENGKVTFFYNCIGDLQTIFVNGKAISGELNKKENERYTFKLDASLLKPGKNEISIVATPYTVRNSWDSPNTDPGVVQVILPAKPYQRSLFNGYAQVIVQSTKESGELVLTARSIGLKEAVLSVNTTEVVPKPFVK